jgi:hypothetical protein
MTYITKGGDAKEDFAGGAVRDIQQGKPRYDLIPPEPLKRLAELYSRGAEKYSPHNWAKGMPTSRCLASLMRHLEQYRAGDKTEDHLSGVIWNAMAIMHFENTAWHDIFDWTPREPPGKGAESDERKILLKQLEDSLTLVKKANE